MDATEAAAQENQRGWGSDMTKAKGREQLATMLAGQQGMSVEQAGRFWPRRHRSSRWHPRRVKPIALWRVKKRTVVNNWRQRWRRCRR